MLQLSQQLATFLLSQTVFTAEVSNRLSPIVAEEGTSFPFATYKINEETGLSKDATQADMTLLVWYKSNEYSKCATFIDALKPVIEQNYSWQSATIDFIDENQSFVGIINFNSF